MNRQPVPAKPMLTEVPTNGPCEHDYRECGSSTSQTEGKQVLLVCAKCGDSFYTKPRVIKESTDEKPILFS